MPSPALTPDNPAPPAAFGVARWLLALATAVSLLLVLQNYALDLFPDRRVHVSPERIRPYSAEKTFAYVVDFDASEPDIWPTLRSRVRFFEDALEYGLRLRQPDEVILVGGDRFTHEPGRIVFSSTDNTDPRTNRRSYDISTPILYRPAIGVTAMLAFLSCVAAWHVISRRNTRSQAPPRPGASRWRWHLVGATALFLFGLYCNTGTLAPYANTLFPLVMPETGYAYNTDHMHFRVLFDFVDGKDRSVWDHAVFLRRILFPVLGWPLMKLFGFEIGGTLASLALNTAVFAAVLVVLRRRIGERGAVFAGWILALYPGAAYWGGLPYTHSVIFPASLLLMIGLMRLAETTDFRTLALVSLAMGVAYLGYDLAIIFVPATLIMLCWRFRFVAAATSVVIQMVPIAAWIWALTYVFHQPLQNGNSAIYASVLTEFFRRAGVAWWWQQVSHSIGYGFDIFFASNFVFAPALFLVVLALNPLTSRVRFRVAEMALLASGVALFLVLNLAPSDAGGWEMRGNWIARLYQPVFPALVLFVARWWQDLPTLSRGCRAIVVSALAGATLGDALIVFGPILDNPWRVSETAFYRFYDHTDAHFFYERNLRELGRRPIGFPRRVKAPPFVDVKAQQAAQLEGARQALDGIRKAIEDNQAALNQVKRAYRDVGRGIAEAQSTLYSKRLGARLARGEISADEAKRQARTLDDFIWPSLKSLLADPSIETTAQAPRIEPAPNVISEVQVAILADSARLTSLVKAVGQTQNDLKAAITELARVQDELARFEKGGDQPTHP
jgi:hypothetical protein